MYSTHIRTSTVPAMDPRPIFPVPVHVHVPQYMYEYRNRTIDNHYIRIVRTRRIENGDFG